MGSFPPCNVDRMRHMPSRSMTSWIDAYENGSPTPPIFIHHPQSKLHEVHYDAHVAALEDKIAQGATVMVLNAIYEGDFVGFSYGF